MRLGIRILTAAASLAGCAAAPIDPLGAWGGNHVSLLVGVERSELEFDCAVGRIDGPFTLAADGSFDLQGVFVREFGGPVREGEILPERPARYSGDIAGARMRLAITLEGGGSLGEYALEKGAAPRLFKCQ
jgi:hypothetical protein